MTDSEGRTIRLTFGQVVWGLSVLLVLVGQWIRFEVRLTALEKTVTDQHTYTRGEIDLMSAQANTERNELRRRIERIESKVDRTQ